MPSSLPPTSTSAPPLRSAHVWRCPPGHAGGAGGAGGRSLKNMKIIGRIIIPVTPSLVVLVCFGLFVLNMFETAKQRLI